MNEWIERYERYLTLLNKSERTIINYTKTLKKIIKDEKIEDIEEFVDMDREWWFEWVGKQREIGKTSIATINCKIKQMSSFYHFLVNENIVNSNPLYKFPKVNQTNGLQYKEKCMTDEQAKALLRATDDERFMIGSEYINCRNKLIVYLLLNIATRIEETSRIRLEDLDLENENRIYIRGKGHSGMVSRFTNVNDKVKDLILECISYNPNRTYLFESEEGMQLGTQGIRNVFYLARSIAQVENVTPHMCRHYVGSSLAERGVEAQKIGFVLGHSKGSKVAETFYIKPKGNMNDILEKIDLFD